MSSARGVIGIVLLCFIAWVLSSNRRRIPWKTVIGGLLLQWALALIVLKTETGRAMFDAVGRMVTAILLSADDGARFVFGRLAGDTPQEAIAGIKIFTTIIVVAALSSIGYHYGLLQRVVRGMAWLMRRALGITGPESLSGAANVFLGQTEAPLLIKPYLPFVTRSEMMAIMVGGFANISVGVMAYYVSLLGVNSSGEADETRMIAVARHLLTASLMSAPAAFVIAKIMEPPTLDADSSSCAPPMVERTTRNGLDAATTGASDGLQLAINVIAMLIAFIGLVTLLNMALGAVGNTSAIAPLVDRLGMKQLDLTGILGLIFAPIAWLNGVQWDNCRTFGGLLGTSMATNEMIAYRSLSGIVRDGSMSERSIVMATYSLCGFANLSSIGIQIGGIGSLAPSRRGDLAALGLRVMIGGAMATWMTRAIAGMLI